MDIVKEFCSTEGRLNRMGFFKRYFAVTIMGATATFVTSCMAALLTSPTSPLIDVITIIWAVLASVCSFMIMTRRLHDLGRSGWYVLVTFIPLVGLIFLIYLFFARGQAGPNEYGFAEE